MKKLILTILVIASIYSCSKDDDNDIIIEPFLGSWGLNSIENEAFYSSPEDENIIIIFEESEYTGETNNNDFGGDYEISGDSLYLTNSFTSDTKDSQWGLLFYESLQRAYDEEGERAAFYYIVSETSLTLRSEEEVMVFDRLE